MGPMLIGYAFEMSQDLSGAKLYPLRPVRPPA